MLDTPDLVAMHLAAMAVGAIAVAISSRASPEELEQILAHRPAGGCGDRCRVRRSCRGRGRSALATHQADPPRARSGRLEAAPATPLVPVPRKPAIRRSG